MSEVAIFGLNSGLDTKSIIEKLVSLNRRTTDLTVAKRKDESQKLAAFQELKSKLQTFKSVVFDLRKENRFLSIAGGFANNNSNDNNSVTAISTTSQASSGTFTLKVLDLAKEGKVVSDRVSAITDIIPVGTLEIAVGGKRTLISVDSSNNTLEGLRLAINNSGADVKAEFLNDGDSSKPIRLVVSGKSTGADNAVSLNLFQSLIGTGSQTVFSFQETQAAQDAKIEVDGLSITKSSNTISDVIAGTTLTLQSAGSGIITLESDFQAVKDKVVSFVDGFNELIEFINEKTFLDIEANTQGILFGNFSVQNLGQTLRDVVSSQVAGVSGSFSFLSQIGVTTEEGGLLSVDDSKLAAAIDQDPGSVARLFSSRGSTSTANVAFVGFTEKTQPGTFDVRVSGGVPQLSVSGRNEFTDATGSGNFFTGAQGSPGDGLTFRLVVTGDGNFGTITLSTGIAETINRELANLTDFSRSGPLSAEIDTATKTIDNFDETIDEQEERLDQFEANLKAKFTNLEVVLGRLNSQRDAFNNSLAGLQSIFGKR
ncbi:MAG: flagellar filament capping protein FliD [Nitrospinales bacterium]